MDIVNGAKTRPTEAAALVETIEGLNLTGTLYLGFPVLRSLSGGCIVDALLISREAGVLALAFTRPAAGGPGEDDAEGVNSLYVAVERQLKAHKGLRAGRHLSIDFEAIGLLPPGQAAVEMNDAAFKSVDELPAFIQQRSALSDDEYQMVNEALEGMGTLRPPASRVDAPTGSKGAVMREIERHIANLDWYQKRAAIEFPEGPQRIRGLAGSGKTVVLAMKTAYLHGSHPDWSIAVTFQTRALQQQLRDLIRGFYIALFGTEPDFDKVQVIHAWGSARQKGFYSDICHRQGLPAQDFNYAKANFGRDKAFGGLCAELLRLTEAGDKLQSVWDVVLIDEAQDFPPEFFELAYLVTKTPNRVVFAYDELQNLSNQSMHPVFEMFGKGADGKPRVADLTSRTDEPTKDIVLPVCYRNTPWALTIAHALGFGVYRDEGLIQFFDSPDLWDSVGYELLEGDLTPGTEVKLARKKNSYPSYIEGCVDPADAVTCHVFDRRSVQAQWVADQVEQDLGAGGLKPRDILIILSNPISAKSDSSWVLKALSGKDIPAHVAGVTSTVDALFEEDSVAITGIYRAKGNEAAIVYILDADYTFEGLELIKRRNIIFTAVTRSRGWVRICGCGREMEGLKKEVQRVVDAGHQLDFRVPTASELEKLRRIHRDLTPAERGKAQKAENALLGYLEEVAAGELDPETLPKDMREKLKRLFAGEE